MAYWVNVEPRVVSAIEAFGFTGASLKKILEALEYNLGEHGDTFREDRWKQCPDDCFTFIYVLTDGEGRLHALHFVVQDSEVAVGVLNVAWVEHDPGNPV